MNAAARVISRNNVFQGKLLSIIFPKDLLLLLILLLLMLFSSISIVFTTNAYRLSLTDYENLLQKQDQLKLENSKLILEQASWDAPGVVENYAHSTLGMDLPSEDRKNFYYIRIK